MATAAVLHLIDGGQAIAQRVVCTLCSAVCDFCVRMLWRGSVQRRYFKTLRSAPVSKVTKLLIHLQNANSAPNLACALPIPWNGLEFFFEFFWQNQSFCLSLLIGCNSTPFLFLIWRLGHMTVRTSYWWSKARIIHFAQQVRDWLFASGMSNS